MLKIALSGKAKSGKDTFSKLLISSFKEKNPYIIIKSSAFADPIKKIIKLMFPQTKDKYLYGKSEYRENIIPGAFLNNSPLTYRLLLQNLGTEVAQSYKKDIWLDVMDSKLKKAEKSTNIFIITDLRFIHEYNYVKNNNFIIIRVLRNNNSNMTHISETDQNNLKDSDFDYIINNNGSINELEICVKNLIYKLSNKAENPCL